MVDNGSGGVFIPTTAGQTINSYSSYQLTNQWQTVSLQSDNTNWIVIAAAG
jgi:hypothetical protein